MSPGTWPACRATPRHGRGQRPLPRRRQPVSARQQRQPLIQPAQQPGHAQRLHLRRRQLDRQRHSIQPGHQPRHRRGALVIQREMRIRAAGPVREQRHRLRPARVSQVVEIWQRQRRQPVPGLPGHPQRLPAGRQHPHIITSRQQPRAQRRGRADHMLAVVQYQQHLLAGQRPRQRLGRRQPRLLAHPQRRGHRRRDLHRVRHRRQLRQPRPVGEPARHLPGHLRGQPGLARPARPGHRHQPVIGKQARDPAQRLGPADEAGQRRREAMHATGRGRVRRLRLPLPGRQHVRGRGFAAGRRDEQSVHWLGQAQRPGQQERGVLAGRAVNAPLQVTDRPRAQPCRLRQLLLSQPGLGPQLPQQPGELQHRRLYHHAGIPSRVRSPRPGTTAPRQGGQHQDYAGPGHWTTTDYQAVGHPGYAATATIGCWAVQSSNATWPPATGNWCW